MKLRRATLSLVLMVAMLGQAKSQLNSDTDVRESMVAGVGVSPSVSSTTHIKDTQHFEVTRCSDGVWENAPTYGRFKGFFAHLIGRKYHKAQVTVACKMVDEWTAINVNTTVGLNDLLTNYWKGSSYTAAWFVGLKGTGTVLAADTAASHSGWTDITTYSNGTRPALTLGTASAGSIDNTASKAVFNINGSTTIFGAFLITNSAVGGTSGTLWGGTDFSGSRALQSGDTLTVTVTLTAS